MFQRLGQPCVSLTDSLRHVRLHHDRVAVVAQEILDQRPVMPDWDHPSFPASPGPELDAVVVLGNVLNYCYWVPGDQEPWSMEVAGRREVDVFAVFGALTNALADGVDLLDGRFLASDEPDGP